MPLTVCLASSRVLQISSGSPNRSIHFPKCGQCLLLQKPASPTAVLSPLPTKITALLTHFSMSAPHLQTAAVAAPPTTGGMIEVAATTIIVGKTEEAVVIIQSVVDLQEISGMGGSTGDLDEEVYMKQPEGFVMPGNEHKVCKLVKSLYGLKQAPKQWHQKFDDVVLSNGFTLNQSDKCVYSKFDMSVKGVIICLYVDDMLIFGTDQRQVDMTKDFLSSQFSMKDMGEAEVILGIRIKREHQGISISQSH